MVLKENVQTLSEKWSELAYIITEAATDLDDAEAVDIVDNLSFNPFQVPFTFRVLWGLQRLVICFEKCARLVQRARELTGG